MCLAEETQILQDQFCVLQLTMSSQQDRHADGLQNNSLFALCSDNMPACLTSSRVDQGDFNQETLMNADDVSTI